MFPLCSSALALSSFFWAPLAVLQPAELLRGCLNWWVLIFFRSGLCFFWNWPWLFKISLVPYENLPSNSSAANYHFCCASASFSIKNTPIEEIIFPLTPFAAVIYLIYADLDFFFYPAVCNVSDSHFFGWTGRCHCWICFQTWGKLEFGR